MTVRQLIEALIADCDMNATVYIAGEHVKARHTVETYLVDDTPTLIEITSADWSISGRGAYREYRLED